ncbi:transposase [Aminobacter sp. Y103A]|uniref:DUF7674 family protein n=1 Tax=Aminobacter sp. Y103A TaxID=1870862 RepID=UPI0025731188|nr:hypothetical protein [Aminobacter sp. SS-2016]BBD38828.1 transposase [Aminobacter sp. SS-2016]
MISRQDMFDVLLEVDPTFQPVWDAFADKWREQIELPLYLALGDLARHVVGKLESGRTDELQQIFAVVERWLADGDELVQEAATIGLLEDLQNLNVHKSTSPDQLKQWLGPLAAGRWIEAERFWSGQIAKA